MRLNPKIALVASLVLIAPAVAHADAAPVETTDIEQATFVVGFETAEQDGVQFYQYGSNPRPDAEEITPTDAGPPIEGQAVAVLGGDVERIVFTLDEDVAGPLVGRRVAFRAWYRPEGTRATVRIVWLSGSVDGQLKRAEPTFFVHNMGQIMLQPTGRATDTGWIELSSGPVDFAAGAQLPPAYVSIEDANATDAGIEAMVARDPEARVLVDGFWIEDLGEAAVPAERCTASTEATTCGEFGICHLGHCTDAAIYLGAAPVNRQVRDAYLQRRLFEQTTFNGVRYGVDFDVSGANSANAKEFWGGLIDATNNLVDGHSTVPRARTTNLVSAGACAYLSDADLMPGTPEAPMVWETFDDVPYGALMRPGDIITSIDGLPPLEFLELVRREIDYGGDPNGRAAMLTPRLLQLAAQTGSPWEVERCDSMTACAPEDIERITIDPYPDLQPIWDNAPPSFRFRVPLCDFRIDRLNGEEDERAYGFAGSATDTDVEMVMFNGFPRANTGGGQSGWLVTLTAVMQAQPAMVLLDQRWGTGGYPDALQGLLDLLLRADDPVFYGETIPAGTVPMGTTRRALQTGCDNLNCGMYYLFGRTPSVDGPAGDTRIALLNGYDVSANDFFARRLEARPGRTRLFGHGPTFGAFGFACNLPPHLPGEQKFGYQCTDTVFSDDLVNPSTDFESGYGVQPDEIVRQRQSDIVQGIDTMRARALEWLREGT